MIKGLPSSTTWARRLLSGEQTRCPQVSLETSIIIISVLKTPLSLSRSSKPHYHYLRSVLKTSLSLSRVSFHFQDLLFQNLLFIIIIWGQSWKHLKIQNPSSLSLSGSQTTSPSNLIFTFQVLFSPFHTPLSLILSWKNQNALFKLQYRW